MLETVGSLDNGRIMWKEIEKDVIKADMKALLENLYNGFVIVVSENDKVNEKNKEEVSIEKKAVN